MCELQLTKSQVKAQRAAAKRELLAQRKARKVQAQRNKQARLFGQFARVLLRSANKSNETCKQAVRDMEQWVKDGMAVCDVTARLMSMIA